MPKLEPTYLRYVYDGLNKGSLNAEHASASPQGFIGLYEQEFTQKTHFTVKKKVNFRSTYFVVIIFIWIIGSLICHN